MNTDENWRDEHERKDQQWESDKSRTTSQVVEYFERWKAGAQSSEDTERCQTFFDIGYSPPDYVEHHTSASRPNPG
ncbi:hypothetical protein FA577_19980 [Salmonella enterica]|nr:hypothetical protein [Salmonella enterica]